MSENKKRMSSKVVVVSILVGAIFFCFIWGSIFSAFSGTSQEMRPVSAIDIVYVTGTIQEGDASYNHNWTLDYIDELMNEDSNRGILLYVNSPGGGIYESDELYLKLKQYKEKTNRPVYAYMAQTAASGGLYVCMAADKIYANRMTMTGSIGVIMSLTDTTGLQELIGIKEEHITSGKNKAMGNPLTDEQRDILQSLIDESYNIFVDVVAENRNLTTEEVKKLADGRVYSPEQAKSLGLIDEIGTVEEALNAMKTENNLQGCSTYSKTQPTTFLDELLGAKTEDLTKWGQITQVKEYIENNNSPKLMYMYTNN